MEVAHNIYNCLMTDKYVLMELSDKCRSLLLTRWFLFCGVVEQDEVPIIIITNIITGVV